MNLGIPRPSMDSKQVLFCGFDFAVLQHNGTQILSRKQFNLLHFETIFFRLGLDARPSKYCQKLLFFFRVILTSLEIQGLLGVEKS